MKKYEYNGQKESNMKKYEYNGQRESKQYEEI